MDTRKIVLVTGANTGLGYEIVKALCASQTAYEVLVGGRSLPKAEHAAQTLSNEFPTTRSHLRAVQIDLEDDSSIEALFKLVQDSYGRLDALVNNAGTLFDTVAPNMAVRELWNRTWNVNVTGTHILTTTFAPLLLKSRDPRLIFMTSGTATLAGTDNFDVPWNIVPAKGWPKTGSNHSMSPSYTAYRTSKTGLNMMMREWYRYLKEDGVKVWAVSPGYLATGLGGSRERNMRQGAADPAIGGNFVKDVLEGKRDGDVGKAIQREMVQPW